MFHAPTSDPKQQADRAKANPPPQKRGAYPSFDQALILGTPPAAAAGLSSPKATAPRRQKLARLQRAYGNQAVLRMLRAEAIQAKLTISEPGDVYEQEADRVADQVMRMPDPMPIEISTLTVTPPTVYRMCSQCEDEVGKRLHAKQAPQGTPEVTSQVEAEVAALNAGGRPLPEAIRDFFEPRFGCDFGSVRIHTGSDAAALARTVSARAFTVGHNVVFGAGEYAPQNDSGRWLLAHELAHTLQQTPSAATAYGLAAGLDRRADAHIARIVCLNPDICAVMNSRKTCLPLSCGWGGSGTCSWIGIEGGCCCLGAQRRTPQQAEQEAQEAIPSWIWALLGAAAAAAIIACFATGVCELAAIVAAVGEGVAAIIMGILEALDIVVVAQVETPAAAPETTGTGEEESALA